MALNGGAPSGPAGRLRHWYHLPVLQARFGERAVLGLYTAINGFITIGLLAALARATHQPYLFPSLGPTAIILFVTPHARVSAPRNVLLGHLIGVLAGYGALWATGLAHAAPAFTTGVTSARILCAALALAASSGAMVWLGCQHPPAGATTLIVALGIMTRPLDLAVLLAGVVLLLAQAVVINRIAGLGLPWWHPAPAHPHRGER